MSAVPPALLLRRLALLVPASLLGATGCWLAWCVAQAQPGGLSNPFNAAAFGLFCLLFSFMAFTAWPVLLGLGLWVSGRRQVPLEREALAIAKSKLVPSQTTRTAVLIPAYHENPHEVFARVHAMHASLAALQPVGSPSDIDFFVLSDSQNPTAIKAEAVAYRACLAALGAHGPKVYYRRRENNAKYKVGNIEEFCTRWGAAYDHMLVLDADSLMAGETIRRLIVLLERHPAIGLLQTSYLPAGRDTLFCRVMQFATRLYLMPAAMGLEFWQGANGNYWGHNAIFRTRAFTESCGLPELPGKAPLGGRILSHDIVEAAFVARGGWQAWLLPNLPGTYEELPTNLFDYMQRDRRWCAGNLQHQHIIRAERVPFINRLHMLLGIFSYAMGPVWLGFLLLSVAGALTDIAPTGLQLATAGLLTPTLAGRALFWLSFTLLLAPKLLTILLALARADVRKGFGGAGRLLASAFFEQIFVMLLQPVVMLFYTSFVIRPLCGSVVKWEAQPRTERGISWHEAWLRHQAHLAFAAALLAIALMVNPKMLLWLAPVIIGLFAAPLFSVVTSRVSLGRLARRWQLFQTVDERAPCAILKSYQTLVAQPPAKASKVTLPALPAAAPCTMLPQPLRYPRAQVASAADLPLPVEA